MIHYWMRSSRIRNSTYIPKYYDPEIRRWLESLGDTHECVAVAELVDEGVLSLGTGHEIGKSAYGTGDIPFVRTSDISNWEIKSYPKQGVSRAIYEEYARRQDVQVGDVLLVRDGTYLIGTNCFVTSIDKEILYQSHILKIRVREPSTVPPELLLLALNSELVQRQIRSVQFTADIIDTIGQRFLEVVIPLPRSEGARQRLTGEVRRALDTRIAGKAFIKHCPYIIENVLASGSVQGIDDFLALPPEQLADELSSRAVTSEFGSFESFWLSSDAVRNSIFLPKYYDPSVDAELRELEKHCHIERMSALRDSGVVEYHTGDEIGKMAYGTGDIPFIRTSDFANWEIKHDPKQAVSESIYSEYADSQDVREHDIFLVRDGTYLVGSSCMVTVSDARCLFCGGLYKIRVKQGDLLDPFLFLGLLNSFIVKRQMRSKQLTRDVIDTIGRRIDEVYVPIPKDRGVRQAISEAVQSVVCSRIEAREEIAALARQFAQWEPG